MFKHSGIIRRIDDFGRIVIPKEVRRKFRILDGDPIELCEDGENIVLRKYSAIGLSCESVQKILSTFSKSTSHPVILCSTNSVLNSFRVSVKTPDFLTAKLCDALHKKEKSYLGYEITDESRLKVKTLAEISVEGTLEGALIIPQTSGGCTVTAEDIACLELCAKIIAELLI